MTQQYRLRRSILSLIVLLVITFIVATNVPQVPSSVPTKVSTNSRPGSVRALDALETLPIKGRAPKTNYSRDQFGSGWSTINGCDTRNIILHRDMPGSIVDGSCNVTSGILHDPYTGKTINFVRGTATSGDVQIDHVVALSDAWQKGAQLLNVEVRQQLANDPLELLAVDGPANQQKSDGDAATWLPSNKSFRCEYVARQIAVKLKYNLWVTQSERNTIATVLSGCLEQTLPGID